MTLPGSMCMRGSGGQALCKSGGLRAKAILLVLALIVSGMSGLSYAQSGDDALTELRRLKSADPVADADRAVSAGDTRLLGLAGFALEVPGASERDRRQLGVREIRGTTDVFDSVEHLQLQELARGYAERYNRRVLQRAAKGPSR